MSEALQQFHFLRPLWLLGLLALPLLLGLAWRRDRTREALAHLVDAELLPHLLHGKSASRRWPALWLMLGWTLGTLAMAGPTWSRVAQPLYAQRSAQVVALSMSQHMLARDVAPSRLDRARYKARDLLTANHDGLNALIAYAGEAFVVAPLTSDAGSLHDLLDALAPDTMPVDGDNAAQAIERGVALIQGAKAGGGAVVLITDDADDAAVAAARKAREAGVRVSVLGVGTPQGAPVPLGADGFLRDNHGDMVMATRNDTALRKLADAGGGVYVPIRDDHGDIDALHATLRSDSHPMLAADQQGDEWQDRGPWLLLPLLPLLALSFRRGWLVMLPLLLLPCVPGAAHASAWSDLWRRPDQQAAAALQNGDAKRAQQLARDPALRGAAAYRAGDYVASANALRTLPGSDAAYNLGNALARQGDYQGALAAYDRALKANPGNADAQANRKAVEDWLRRQPPQKSGAQNDQGKGGQGATTNPPSDAQGKHGQQGQEDGKQKQEEGKPSGDAQGDSQDGGHPQPSQPPNAGEQSEPKADKQGQTPEQQAEEKARQAQAQQALQKQMDQALGKSTEKPRAPATHDLGTIEADDAQSRLPAEVRQALQRVPDDPGALLRRKFDLEYRQRHGGVSAEDDSP